MGAIACQRNLFDIPPEVAYFNCAYMSPLLTRAAQAGERDLRAKLRPWEIGADHFFDDAERARSLFAQLIGTVANDIAIIPAVSYGMAIAGLNLAVSSTQTIVLQAEEFPSTVYAWRSVAKRTGAHIRTVARPENGDWTSSLLEAIDHQTAVVSICQTHWICGGEVDLVAISRRCKHFGASLVLDLTQSCGALPFDVELVDPDFAMSAAYKWLLGPYGLGFLYVAPRHQRGTSLEQAWGARDGSQDFRNLIEYTDTLRPGARRFDVGEHANWGLMPIAIDGLQQLLNWSVEAISENIGRMIDRIIGDIGTIRGAFSTRKFKSNHFLSMTFCNSNSFNVKELKKNGIFISIRANRIRITPHLYNNDDDVCRLTSALKMISININQ